MASRRKWVWGRPGWPVAGALVFHVLLFAGIDAVGLLSPGASTEVISIALVSPTRTAEPPLPGADAFPEVAPPKGPSPSRSEPRRASGGRSPGPLSPRPADLAPYEPSPADFVQPTPLNSAKTVLAANQLGNALDLDGIMAVSGGRGGGAGGSGAGGVGYMPPVPPEIVKARRDLESMSDALKRLIVLRRNWRHNEPVTACIDERLRRGNHLMADARAAVDRATRALDREDVSLAQRELEHLNVARSDLEALYGSARGCLPR